MENVKARNTFIGKLLEKSRNPLSSVNHFEQFSFLLHNFIHFCVKQKTSFMNPFTI